MANRIKLSNAVSKTIFQKTASKTNAKNLVRNYYNTRGGIRL